MPDLSSEARNRLESLATHHGVSLDAATTLFRAVAAGGGSMAQFSHPELGGMGQWSPGMTMVGDMFNAGLKHRVQALCTDLADLVRETAPSTAGSLQFQSQGEPGAASGSWWPAGLGSPASSGGQNTMRYAYFPAASRLAVQQDGRSSLYDTGSCQIFGASQQQGGIQSLTFSTSQGTMRLEDFAPVDAAPSAVPAPSAAQPAGEPGPPQAASVPTSQAGSGPAMAGGDPLALLERLADLLAKGVLTAEEFAAKKADLLGRL